MYCLIAVDLFAVNAIGSGEASNKSKQNVFGGKSDRAFRAMKALDPPLRQCITTILRSDTESNARAAFEARPSASTGSGGGGGVAGSDSDSVGATASLSAISWYHPPNELTREIQTELSALERGVAPPLEPIASARPSFSADDPKSVAAAAIDALNLALFPLSPAAIAAASNAATALVSPLTAAAVTCVGSALYHRGVLVCCRLAPVDVQDVTLFCRTRRLLDRAADSKLRIAHYNVYSRSASDDAQRPQRKRRVLVVACLGCDVLCLLLNCNPNPNGLGIGAVGSGGISSALIGSAILQRVENARSAIFRFHERRLSAQIDSYDCTTQIVAPHRSDLSVYCCSCVCDGAVRCQHYQIYRLIHRNYRTL